MVAYRKPPSRLRISSGPSIIEPNQGRTSSSSASPASTNASTLVRASRGNSIALLAGGIDAGVEHAAGLVDLHGDLDEFPPVGNQFGIARLQLHQCVANFLGRGGRTGFLDFEFRDAMRTTAMVRAAASRDIGAGVQLGVAIGALRSSSEISSRFTPLLRRDCRVMAISRPQSPRWFWRCTVRPRRSNSRAMVSPMTVLRR